MISGTQAGADSTNLERKFVLMLVVLLTASCGAVSSLWLMQASVILPIGVVLGMGGLTLTVAHYALFRPVRRLTAMARAVGAGDFSQRLATERKDELGSLAFEMNAMCSRLEAARRAAEDHILALEQLRHADRISTLGRLASSVAHELGTPLSVIELRAQLITSGGLASLHQAELNAAVVVEQAQRMTRIIDQVLSFARVRPARLSCVELVSVLRKAISLTDHISKQHRTQVRLHTHRSLIELPGDADKLLQVIVNLVVNGIQASPAAGTLHLRTSETVCASEDDPEGEQRSYVCVEVLDEGLGIAAPNLPRVFEPFFSTRSADDGSGLGLSVAQGIAREHEGWIVASSEPDQGARFTVYLPQLRARGVPRLPGEESSDVGQTVIHR